jgi:hypothetical protein
MFNLKPLFILYKLFTHNLTKYKEVTYKTMIFGMCELNELKFLNLQDLFERGVLNSHWGTYPFQFGAYFSVLFLIFRKGILFLVCRK